MLFCLQDNYNMGMSASQYKIQVFTYFMKKAQRKKKICVQNTHIAYANCFTAKWNQQVEGQVSESAWFHWKT